MSSFVPCSKLIYIALSISPSAAEIRKSIPVKVNNLDGNLNRTLVGRLADKGYDYRRKKVHEMLKHCMQLVQKKKLINVMLEQCCHSFAKIG